MKRVTSACVSALAVAGLLLLSGQSASQQNALKDRLVGTWTFVSALDVHPDGKKVNRWGDNPKGIFIFAASGHFAQFITRSDLPKFAAKKGDQGTAEENKAVLSGLVATFGTWSVNEAEKTVTTRVEGSAYPNLIGVEQKRTIASLSADELKYTNQATTTGTLAEATWKRVK